MFAFNAFQIVVLFIAWPFIVQWLHNASFPGHTPITVAAAVAYVIGFIAMVTMVYESISGRRDRY